jgi:membrane protein
MPQIIERFLLPLAKKISDDELFTRSAAVAYSASLSFAPTIILVASFLGLLRINIVNYLAIQINRLMGYEVGELVLRLADYSKQNVQFASFSGLLGIAILLISGSLFFRQMEDTMAYIFKDFKVLNPVGKRNYYRKAQEAIRRRLMTLIIFLLSVGFATLTLFISFFLTNTLGHYSPLLYAFIYEIFCLLTFSFLFFMTFLCTPARVIKNRIVFIGSIISAFLFLVGKEMIALYIASAGLRSIYGATGTIVVFLIWFYYSSITVFIGAEVISVIAKPSKIS